MARQSRQPVILLTRPLTQSQRFAEELAQAMGDIPPIVISPLMAPVFLEPDLPDRRYAAVILTSETGAIAAGRWRGHLPDGAYCVGRQTARAAVDQGFVVQQVEADANALKSALLRQDVPGPLLHLRGREARGEIAETLTKGGIETDSLIIYAQEACPLSAAASAVLMETQPVILPLFSPRSAQLLRHALVAAPRAPLWVAAISAAVADEAAPLRPERMVQAANPDGPAMVAAVQSLIAAGIAP